MRTALGLILLIQIWLIVVDKVQCYRYSGYYYYYSPGLTLAQRFEIAGYVIAALVILCILWCCYEGIKVCLFGSSEQSALDLGSIVEDSKSQEKKINTNHRIVFTPDGVLYRSDQGDTTKRPKSLENVPSLNAKPLSGDNTSHTSSYLPSSPTGISPLPSTELSGKQLETSEQYRAYVSHASEVGMPANGMTSITVDSASTVNLIDNEEPSNVSKEEKT